MTSRRVFRQHDAVPTNIRCEVLRGLLEEWYLLHQNPSTARIVTRWAHTEDVLTGHTSPGDIVDAVDAASPADKDRILIALIRLFQTGHQMAGRIVLQCFLPKLSTMVLTRYAMRTGECGTWNSDSRSLIIAEFWEVLATYPTHRTTKIPSRLVLDTMHRVTRTKTYTGNIEAPCDPIGLDERLHGESLDETAHEAGPPTTDLSADSDLLAVLHWAYTTNVITKPEARLLSDFYLPQKARRTGPSGTATSSSSAAQRQRRSRVVRKLVAAVRTELDLPTGHHQTAAVA